MTLREVTDELSAQATRRVEILKACVGKVYIKSLYLEKFCIGEGYDVLEDFFERWFGGNVTKENILHNIELSVLHAVLQSDSHKTTCDFTIDLGDRRIEVFEMVQNFTMPPKLPDLPDIVIIPNPLTEKTRSLFLLTIPSCNTTTSVGTMLRRIVGIELGQDVGNC